jgi:hypothetical protein
MISMRSVTFRVLEDAEHRATMHTLQEAAIGVAPATVQVWAIRLASCGFTGRREMAEALSLLASARERLSDAMACEDAWRVLEDRTLPPRTRLERAHGWTPGASPGRRAA